MNTKLSKAAYKNAEKLLPGGVDSPVRAWTSVRGNPLFISHAKGANIVDVDGNEYIDYIGSWGPLILGHAEPSIIQAITKTAQSGTTFGAPNVLETELAERITKAIPSIEMIRFVNSGTEATMSAIRLARAFTKRDKIIKFIGGYHGHADFLLAKAGSAVATLGLPDSAGIPKQITATTLLAPYNDLQAIKELFEKYKDEIAAVIVEPIAGNMGVVIPQQPFLQGLRNITKENDALLIFDEVITGFRVAWGGAQSLFGITPDLTCLGKIIGGGLPVGAYGGKKEIMQMIAPLGPVYQAGTLSGNPIAMAAGIATLDKIKANSKTYEQLETRAAQLEKGLLNAAKEAEVSVIINRVGSMMTVFFTNKPVANYLSAKQADTKQYATFFHGMIEQNIYLPPSQFEAFFVSLAHSESDIEKTLQATKKVLTKFNRDIVE